MFQTPDVTFFMFNDVLTNRDFTISINYTCWEKISLSFSLSHSCSLSPFLSTNKLWLCENFCQLYTSFALRSLSKTHFCLITGHSGLFLLTLNAFFFFIINEDSSVTLVVSCNIIFLHSILCGKEIKSDKVMTSR